MSKRKLLLITFLFIVILTALHLLWVAFHRSSDHPQAVQGVLDLRGGQLAADNLTLNGEWEFYPDQLLMHEDSRSFDSESVQFIQVPGDWSAYWEDSDSAEYRYGTYRLRILIDNDSRQSWGIAVREARTASTLFVDGYALYRSGEPAERLQQYVPHNVPYWASFTTEENEIEVIIHMSHYEKYGSVGGISRSVKFGTERAISRDKAFSIGTQLVVLTVFLLYGIFAVILYLFGSRQKVLITFFAAILSAAVSLMVDDDKLLLIVLQVDFVWATRLFFLSYDIAALLLLLLVLQLAPDPNFKGNRYLRWFLYFGGGFCLFIIWTPIELIYQMVWIDISLMMGALLLVLFLVLRQAWKGRQDFIFLLLATASLLSSATWGLLSSWGLFEGGFYPFDYLIAFICFTAYWFRQYFRNAEETAKLAQRLKKADKLKDDFLANTSHELRSPLHDMINIAQTVLDKDRSSLSLRSCKDLELLIAVGGRMDHLIRDLLDISHLRDNNIRLNLKQLHVQPIIKGVVDMLSFMSDGKSIRIYTDISEDFPQVLADEERLVHILLNLLDNTIKFTSQGSVHIIGDTIDGYARIHITDTGVGMDETTRAEAMMHAEQEEYEMLFASGGLGLGLSICRQLIELHGGTLAASSVAGEGSVFTFTLLLAEHTTLTQAETSSIELTSDDRETLPARQSSGLAGRPRVLCVDDDPVNLNILTGILSGEQYEIETTTSGSQALLELEGGQWDLIIADVIMPQISGYELCKMVRQNYSLSELPILLLTTRSRPEDIYSGFLAGANDYVSKPVNALELKARVQALTDLKQSVNEQLRMEGAYLQAQIQPHFLFNAMNAISALSDIDVTRMRQMLDAFSAYLRISFDFMSSQRLVTLEYELELVRSYLYIEKERFEERLEVVWELEECTGLLLPPLTIQPLVENAVRHGILSRWQGGRVVIRLSCLEKSVVISIEDNGVGMEKEKVERLLDNRGYRTRGVGLVNTDRRLKQLYGMGLIIKSEPGAGTTVSFTIDK